MTAKQQAIRDIKNDLRQNNRCFIAFCMDLNPIMDLLVENYIKHQEEK